MLITTEHLNAALDIAASRGLSASDIADVRLNPNGTLRSIVVEAAVPGFLKKTFLLEMRACRST